MSRHRQRWVQGLQVGDRYEDCNYRVCELASYSESRALKSWLRTLFRWFSRVPGVSSLEEWVDDHAPEWLQETYDKTLTSTAERCCSALSCADSLDPVDINLPTGARTHKFYIHEYL